MALTSIFPISHFSGTQESIICNLCHLALDYGPNASQLEEDLSKELLIEMSREYYEEIAESPKETGQNTVEWLEERKDRITASNFGMIVKRKVRISLTFLA